MHRVRGRLAVTELQHWRVSSGAGAGADTGAGAGADTGTGATAGKFEDGADYH